MPISGIKKFFSEVSMAVIASIVFLIIGATFLTITISRGNGLTLITYITIALHVIAAIGLIVLFVTGKWRKLPES